MLEIDNVSKNFSGLSALHKVSFNVKKGEILGIVGQNGAGKSTLLRIIMHFLNSTSGEIKYDKRKITHTLYDEIGFLPEERSLFVNYSIKEQLVYFSRLHGIRKNDAITRIKYFLNLFEVKGDLNTKINALSKGNQQKIQLISTLIHDPKIIILDEPFSGLDPVNADIFMKNIKSLRDNRNKTIIFSSHNMNNVEKICDKVVMLKNGKVVLNGTINQIKESFGRVNLSVYSKRSMSFFESINGVSVVSHDVKENVYNLKLANSSVGKKVFLMIKEDGYTPVFNQDYPSLSEIFTIKVEEDNENYSCSI